MKLKVDGTLEVPSVVATLLLGIPVYKNPDSTGLEISLDQQGLDRLSFILGILYSDGNKYQQAQYKQPQQSVQIQQPLPQTKPQVVEEVVRPELKVLNVPVVEQKVSSEKKSLKDLAAKSKKFIG